MISPWLAFFNHLCYLCSNEINKLSLFLLQDKLFNVIVYICTCKDQEDYLSIYGGSVFKWCKLRTLPLHNRLYTHLAHRITKLAEVVSPKNRHPHCNFVCNITFGFDVVYL